VGYLVGNLSTMKHYVISCSDVQISTRNDPSTVTMPQKNACTELVRNLGFLDLEILENSDISLLATLTDIENTIYMRQ
jgi:hypothetical protein